MNKSVLIKSLSFALIIVVLIKGIFPDYSLVGLFALLIFFQQLSIFLFQLGECIPLRSLFSVMMCLQMLVGPSLVYNGLEKYQIYKMNIAENEYFLYVIPAVLLFIVGLFYQGWQKGERIDKAVVEKLINDHKEIPFILLTVGFIASLIIPYVSQSLNFVFYFISMLKYPGLFLLFFSEIRYKFFWLTVVFIFVISSSLSTAMFNDLLTWMITAGAVLNLKYYFPLKTKILAFVLFALLALFIQSIKESYRKIAWDNSKGGSIGALQEAKNQSEQKGGVFSIENVGPAVGRINQGWIISRIINQVPRIEPYSNGGTLIEYFKAALLPRLLFPDKLEAGDQKIFTKYTGVYLRKGTSMALSSVGDGYINFGIVGGCIFMFFYGLLFNYALKVIGKHSNTYPYLIIFATIIFVYPIRPDCELQTILGHLVKTSFFVFLMLQLWRKQFMISQKYLLRQSFA